MVESNDFSLLHPRIALVGYCGAFSLVRDLTTSDGFDLIYNYDPSDYPYVQSRPSGAFLTSSSDLNCHCLLTNSVPTRNPNSRKSPKYPFRLFSIPPSEKSITNQMRFLDIL